MRDQHMLSAMTAALLRSSCGFAVLGGVLGALSGSAAFISVVLARGVAGLLFGVALALGIALAWLVLRIRFDVAAFERIAAQDDVSTALADFDAALQRMGLRQTADMRDLACRVQGARGLVTRLAALVCAQLFLFLAGLIALYAA